MTDSSPPPGGSPAPARAPLLGRLLLRVPLALAAIALATFAAIERYAPLDPTAKPHLFTGAQLALMELIPARCTAALARAEGISFTPTPRPMDNGCGYPDGVRVRSGAVNYGGGGVLLRCPAAVALIMWERNVLQPAAQRAFGRPVTAVQTFGTYACRNVYHRSTGRRSQHATANAIDIAGMTLAGGQSVSVRRDWTDGAKGAFLREVRSGACGPFRAVLSPDYNAAHADHLHLDMGRWSTCR